MAKSVFYSFHYSHDVNRIQLVRNIHALEAQSILNPQKWEEVKQQGKAAIEKWIHDQMAYKKAVILLIGKHTASRPWVIYEIKKAWADGKPLVGIRIHGLSSFGDVDAPGANPFERAGLRGVPIFDPTSRSWNGKIDSKATYAKLQDNLEFWSGQGVVKPRW